MQKENITLIGVNIPSLICAIQLQDDYDVRLIDQKDMAGITANIDKPITFNTETQPLFSKLVKEINVKTKTISNSDDIYIPRPWFVKTYYSITNKYGFEALKLNTQGKKFKKNAITWLNNNLQSNLTLSEYLDDFSISRKLREQRIWPTLETYYGFKPQALNEMSAWKSLMLLKRHRMLDLSHLPKLYAIFGGDSAFKQQLISHFTGDIITDTRVTNIIQHGQHLLLNTSQGQLPAEAVICSTHVSEVNRLLDTYYSSNYQEMNGSNNLFQLSPDYRANWLEQTVEKAMNISNVLLK